MIDLRDIVYGLYGAYRLAVRDPAGMTYFDRTVVGFWRSFAAALIGLPAFVLLVASSQEAMQSQIHPAGFVLVETIGYAVHWLAFPGVMIHVAAALGRPERFLDVCIAWNWARVIEVYLFALLSAIGARGLLPAGITDFLSLAAIAWVLLYQWYIARIALGANGLAAVGIVMLDFMLSLVIAGATRMIES